MNTKKLIVSKYFQHLMLSVGAVLLIIFVCEIEGILITFLTAAVLAYVSNLLMRRLEQWRVPSVVEILKLFLVFSLAMTAAQK